MTKGDFFKSYDEHWVIEPTSTGCRFTFNDQIGFPYGPLGLIIGWNAARGARKTGVEILGNLKRLAEGRNRDRSLAPMRRPRQRNPARREQRSGAPRAAALRPRPRPPKLSLPRRLLHGTLL